MFAEEPTFTVTELNAGIGAALGRAFSNELWVRGEIANLSRPPSGHVYFDLVDGECALSVTLWASDRQVVNAVLREGLKQLDKPPRHRAAFHTGTVDLGRFRLDNVDDIAQALALGETDAYR